MIQFFARKHEIFADGFRGDDVMSVGWVLESHCGPIPRAAFSAPFVTDDVWFHSVRESVHPFDILIVLIPHAGVGVVEPVSCHKAKYGANLCE